MSWIWMSLFIFMTLVSILFILLFILWKHKYNQIQSSCAEFFNVSNYLEKPDINQITDENVSNTICVVYKHQKLCITIDTTQNIQIYLNGNKKFEGSFKKLFIDENQITDDNTFSIFNMNILIYKFPFSEHTIAFRNVSDMKQIQRLCYNFLLKRVYISPPTNYYLQY